MEYLPLVAVAAIGFFFYARWVRQIQQEAGSLQHDAKLAFTAAERQTVEAQDLLDRARRLNEDSVRRYTTAQEMLRAVTKKIDDHG